ncbi:MerR family transcriptional regulator [Rhodococcoides corynebacterioides]|uniref:MerR family transcriptional regulator n=1 Tax=Rhodococcoides corynebacterioides TaxID=53972 RepID=UPI0008366D88|nr:MerR family transcriptional regulator [Rhodococcus corynebacterioides]
MTRATTTGTVDGYLIGDAAAALEITIDTIRYYEKEGITPAPARGSDGRRRYDDAALAWLSGVVMLRGTGMTIREMRDYAAAYRNGADERERLALLEQHHAVVMARHAEVQRHLAALEHKIAAYRARVNSHSDMAI